MKKLIDLYPNCGYKDVLVKDIKINSKEVEEGDLFVCIKGVTVDRHDYIKDAIKNGAVVLITDRDILEDIPYIKVANTNLELPKLARKFYGYPDKSLELIGVTGTNGKTTVASIIQDLMGNDICGYLGTSGIICHNFNEYIRNTTPDTDILYKYFQKFVISGCKYVSMEASSEAFYFHRLDNIKFKVGIITNITEDHLNTHKTLKNYISCKEMLVKKVKDNGYSILNVDDIHYEEVVKYAKGTILTYGKNNATLEIVKCKYYSDKTIIKLKYHNKLYKVISPLLGEFNVYNLCAVILALLALNYNIDYIIKRIPLINRPLGRVEFLKFSEDYQIVLDYAHTPDAFSNLYKLLKNLKPKRIITVTGSAGGREIEKRGPMGKIILENSDHVIFTTDDPRFESVENIIKDLVSKSNKSNYEIIIDRKMAINKALSIAKKGDIILIAGKGRDNYMAIKDKYIPYNDYEVISEYFEKDKVNN